MQKAPIAYTLIRSGRKTIGLEIRPSLEIVVRAPRRMPAQAVDDFVHRHEGWIETHVQKLRQRREQVGPPLSETEIARLKAAARAYLPGRVAHYAAKMGLAPTGVRITAAEKRFGSCSARNSLCFSYHLMRYQREAIDYVVVHELAHITHKNHGAAFHALVAAHLPDHEKRRALLRLPPARCSDLPSDPVV